MTRHTQLDDVQDNVGGKDERPAVHSAYQQIFAMLVAGEFPSGAPVREAALAQKLGLSRNSVREALSRLVGMDVLEYTPYCGYRLLPYTIRDVLEWTQYRLAVEPMALAIFFESTSWRKREAVFKELEEILEEEDASITAGDAKEMTRNDLVFHMKIVEACGNRRLAGNYLLCSLPFLANLSQQGPDGLVSLDSEQCVDNLMMPELQRRTHDFHLTLLHEMRYGDCDKAIALLREHIALSVRSFRDYFVCKCLDAYPQGGQQNADSIGSVVSLLRKKR